MIRKWLRMGAVGFALALSLAAIGAALLTTGGFVSGNALPAGPSVRIESGTVPPPPGTETTRLEAFGVTALCAATIDVVYNPAVKDATGCIPNPGNVTGLMVVCNPDYENNGGDWDTVRVAAIHATGVPVGDFPLADIVWTAVGNPGACTPLDVQVVNFANCAGGPITVTAEDGENCLPTPTPPPTGTPTGTPTPTPTTPPSEPWPTGTPTPTATPTPTPTPTPTATPVLTPTPTVVVTPTPGITPTPVVTPPPGITPTPGTTPTPGVTPAPGVTPKPAPTAMPPTGAGGLSDGGSAPWAAALAAGGILALLLTATGISRSARRRIE
jgi:hypothetical protein